MSDAKNKVWILSAFMLVLLVIIFGVFYGEMRDDKLHIAVYRENLEKIKTLLARGENLERRDSAGNTPLHIASKIKLEFVDCMVKAGAKVNAKNFNHETPLHNACINGDLEIVTYLIKNGADVNAKDNYSEVPLHKSGKFEISELLIKNGANVNEKNNNGETPIYNVIGIENLKFLELFVKNGASLNEKNNDLVTPLHKAAQYIRFFEISDKENANKLKIFEYLIKSGADVNAKDKDGDTPIYYAIRSDAMPIVELFVKNGANINEKNNKLEMPLNISYENFKILKFLIDNGAQVNTVDIDGNTILHKVVFNDSNINSVKYLVLKDADIDAKNKDGKTSRDLADMEIRNFFLSYKENPQKVKAEIEKEIQEFIVELNKQKNPVEAISIQ